jgi:hypothetical protein
MKQAFCPYNTNKKDFERLPSTSITKNSAGYYCISVSTNQQVFIHYNISIASFGHLV